MTTDLLARVRAFVDHVALPAEERCGGNLHDGPVAVRDELQAAAKSAGVFAPQVPLELGGVGLSRVEQAPILEAAGYSLLGPLAMNCAAPDEGNIHLLDVAASLEQRERYLMPLARGDARSAFAMTEPAPGAGSDPRLLRTTAMRVPGGWSLRGRKWFISGAIGADFLICMARTTGKPGDAGGATMFLVDAVNPGLRIVRNIETLDVGMFGGHAELELDDCRVGDDAVLGEVDAGFVLAQMRLAPARLTHCMRWLGVASRAHDIATDRALQRHAFGMPLGDLGMVQAMLADSEIDLQVSRVLVLDAASILDAGDEAGHASSIAKTFVSEAVWRVVDRSVQICGALGISADLPLARLLREVRPFRIYDGPSETHRWSIAKRALKRRQSVR
jgi:acyl-CoA dehydrogenase